ILAWRLPPLSCWGLSKAASTAIDPGIINMKRALFPGLVFDEQDNPAEVVYVGDEPCYVVDDDGCRRHIPSDQVDRQVLDAMAEQIEAHEDILTDQAAKMLGQDDIFSRAMLLNQFKNIDAQLDQLLETGIPQ